MQIDLLIHLASGMRLSPSEAERLGLDDGVAMPDGDIISIPAVMHNLHCLVLSSTSCCEK